MGLALGVRHVLGLFLLPMTTERGWSREAFAFAIALQNLVWGIAQPFTGMIADRFGSVRVLFAGCLLYGAGLYCMAHAGTPFQLAVSGGLVIGIALSATSFSVVYGALSRIVTPERRASTLGLAGAIGGLAQFAMVPGAQSAMEQFGWLGALIVMAILLTVAAPASAMLNDRSEERTGQPEQSLRHALSEAFAHRGFWLLNAGFLVCGFQLAFIANHLPAYLLDKGLAGNTAVVALSLVALANVAGTYIWGMLGGRFRKKYLLAWVYVLRSAATTVFLLLPVSEITIYTFAFIMGFGWLGTVPLTNGIVAQVFGVRYITTLFGFVFIGHQIGSFLGVWLGGLVFDATRSYDLMWICSILLGLLAALLHVPINDRQIVRNNAALA
ncbi:MFS transporter [Noviherbaspirillum saxi]|uniref:MFS transporter n=2 Tax=Noviherbaspirillum saxi TaxID=2320863 RepID=A0A3A3FP31_9BURK|nr:MFS transporter [Noviherbaspirillum saxi]